MAASYIVTAHGKPFTDRDAAEIKARTLTAELDEPFEAVPHPQGGYVVQPADLRQPRPSAWKHCKTIRSCCSLRDSALLVNRRSRVAECQNPAPFPAR
jgi:hypothetical protein